MATRITRLGNQCTADGAFDHAQVRHVSFGQGYGFVQHLLQQPGTILGCGDFLKA